MAPEKKPPRVVVVGGSEGLGGAIALLFARLDFEVVLAGKDDKRLHATARKLGRGATAYPVDVSSREELKHFFDRVGDIEHLVLAFSGNQGAGPFVTLSLERLREGFESKVWPHLQVAQLALQALQPRASITFVTSATASSSLPGTTGMASINGALEALVRPLAVEVAPVRVNAVSPGVVDSPQFARMSAEAKDSFFAQMTRMLPARRIGRVDEIAEAVYFVATNGFMTGEIVRVDGGGHLGRPR